MIPKQLFFIWLGDEQPDYVNYAIKAYKDMNPDFKVDLIRYTKDEIINSHDNIITICKRYIEMTKNGIDNKYFKYIKHRIESKFNYIQLLSDFLRFELLYYYGGIYLDCDTFPVKKFNENLLNNVSFSQEVLCLRNKKYMPKNLSDDYTYYYDYDFKNNIKSYFIYKYKDIYFVGASKEYTNKEMYFDEGVHTIGDTGLPWIRNLDNDKCFRELCSKFYNKNLKINSNDFISYNYYITHFCNRKWQCDYKKSKLYCELDNYLYES